MPKSMSDFRSTERSLAFAGMDAEPSFDTVARAASTAAIFDMSVQVLCLTHDQLVRWRRYVDELQIDTIDMSVRDLNRATLAEWRTAFGRRQTDMTVLAGFHAARNRQEISAEYANAFIDAVPEGLVVLA